MTLKELQEKRGKLAAEIRRLADKFNADGKEWKATEDRAAFDKVNAEYDAILAEIEAAQKRQSEADAVEARLRDMEQHDSRSSNDPEGIIGRGDSRLQRPIGGEPLDEEARGLALAGFLMGSNNQRCSQRHQEAMRRCGVSGQWNEMEFKLGDTRAARGFQSAFRRSHRDRFNPHDTDAPEFRALSAVTSQDGGALVFPSFVRSIEVNMLYFGGMRQVAETIRTTSGERMVWPTADDTSNTGELLGENTDVTTADPDFAGVAWDAYKFSSKMVKVPYELLEDSAFDLPRVIGQMLGERLGRITNTRFTTGTGANQPAGIITKATTQSAGSTTLTYDMILDLEHSVDVAYRAGAEYMCNDAILLTMRKLKDSYGQYLWQNGISVGQPDRLNGRPLTINNDMDSATTSGKKSILFGQLRNYKIRTVNGIRLRRLDERYAETDQVAFIAFTREDGNLLNAGTASVKVLTH